MFRRLLATVSFLWLGAVFAVAQATLTTTFASNNGGSVGGAVHFDLTVLNPNGVVLSRFDVNCVNPRSTLARLEVWMTNLGGTHVGTQVNPAAGYWSRRAVATMVTAGQDLPTIAVLDQPIPLAAGTYGVALVHVGCAARYTGTATVPPTQTVFASADLRIDAGTAQNVPFSSGVFTPRIANTTVHYSVLSADTVAFSANVIRGPSPLLVQFRDRSVAAGATITGWEWDLDGDGITDSTLQDPFHAYASCGDYSVRLRITTPSGQTSLTWNQMIEVDPLEANFTMTPEVGAPPLVVQFTDTSRLTPLSWAWDFDGDGIADDVSPNPVWAFGPGCHAVTLTVANGCRSAQITRRVTATTDVLVAGGAPNSFVNETSVVFFDLSVTAAEVLSVAGIDFQSYHARRQCDGL
jgi:PKD repeat protein